MCAKRLLTRISMQPVSSHDVLYSRETFKLNFVRFLTHGDTRKIAYSECNTRHGHDEG